MLRPRATHWFELLTGRDQFALTMQTLAATGAAQLETRPLDGSEPVLPRLDDFFTAFGALEAEYGRYWPEERGHAGLVLENPIALLDDTLTRLEAWVDEADPVVSSLRACEARQGELALVARLVEAVDAGTPLAQFSGHRSDLLHHRIYYLSDADTEIGEIGDALLHVFPSQDGAFAIIIATPEDIPQVEARMGMLAATPVPLPDFLPEEQAAYAAQVQAEIAETESACREGHAALDRLAAQTDLKGLLNRVAVLEWLQENSGDISATRHMMRITGWTRSADGAELRAALDRAKVDYALSLDSAVAGNPPMVLDNPWWLKPFEFFPRLLGVPADHDIDPSLLTAFIAPLLFGFMFGDVGQGAVLLVAGLVLSRRIPMLFLLVPGGAVAMVFGLLFGSVFSLEHVVPALWVHPLDEPITLLVAALGIGVALLLLGLALDFVQAVWHRQGLHWLAGYGGLSLAYLGLLGAWFVPVLAWGLPLGLVLTAAGARGETGWSLSAAGAALAEFVEAMMRLLVATVSFSRVGAFALAHAGLSAAIVGVAEALPGPGFWIALLIGNIIILALEGLVTAIQTTRLILFEFFIRFFRAEGREFRPLSAPRSHFNEGTSS
ncbi:V-type ATPase 116kDa subunit family protein [Sinisalibacter aestuarii]|uniref:V-type ATP synthase subunit I n=1 Tax=Sinisalibacter aestuarii TaxID=2949426 RepID=A0ABQ5LUU6_9RHOB|nr:V-type ATPase 116kDa subunit family protein [Sinisalibacter aestuarii]GKY88756.1 hypothetical protein STA1M1_26250 [Sinisalibacter aestuarii]